MARLLFVHAHPDDETLATGVAIAHYVSRGHDVEVLTPATAALPKAPPNGGGYSLSDHVRQYYQTARI